MAKVILFHHAHGLTDGVKGFADELRAGSHEVITPDLFDGRVFETVEEGVAHAEGLGFDSILASAREVAHAQDEEVVYAGFSLGALAAHMLAQTRPGAAGALLFHHGDVAMTTFGDEWPAGVDFQIHVNEDDPFCELEVVREFVQLTGRRRSVSSSCIRDLLTSSQIRASTTTRLLRLRSSCREPSGFSRDSASPGSLGLDHDRPFPNRGHGADSPPRRQ